MPRTSKTSTKTSAKKKSTAVKIITIDFAAPGSIPEKRKVKAGTTVEGLIGSVDKSYVVRVNQTTVNSEYQLQAGDVVRVGVNTKNNI